MQLQSWLDDIAHSMQQESFANHTISRLTAELADHYYDLMEEQSMSSITHDEVIQRLGTKESILRAAKSQRRDSLPWLYFLTLPFIGTFICFIATTAAIMLTMAGLDYVTTLIVERLGGSAKALEHSAIVQIMVQMIWCSIPVLSTLLTCVLASRILARRDNKVVWVIVAFVIIACLSAPMQNSFSWDRRSMSSGLNISMSLAWLMDGLRIAQITLPMIALAIILRQRRQRSPVSRKALAA